MGQAGCRRVAIVGLLAGTMACHVPPHVPSTERDARGAWEDAIEVLQAAARDQNRADWPRVAAATSLLNRVTGLASEAFAPHDRSPSRFDADRRMWELWARRYGSAMTWDRASGLIAVKPQACRSSSVTSGIRYDLFVDDEFWTKEGKGLLVICLQNTRSRPIAIVSEEKTYHAYRPEGLIRYSAYPLSWEMINPPGSGEDLWNGPAEYLDEYEKTCSEARAQPLGLMRYSCWMGPPAVRLLPGEAVQLFRGESYRGHAISTGMWTIEAELEIHEYKFRSDDLRSVLTARPAERVTFTAHRVVIPPRAESGGPLTRDDGDGRVDAEAAKVPLANRTQDLRDGEREMPTYR